MKVFLLLALLGPAIAAHAGPAIRYEGTAGTNVVAGTATVSGIACNGSSLNVDSGTMFVDCTNNRVGVGTTSPGSAFHAQGTVSISSATPTRQLTIQGQNSATLNGIAMSRGSDDNGQKAHIFNTGGFDWSGSQGGFLFVTEDNARALSSGYDTVFISSGTDGIRYNLKIEGSNGNVGVGTTVPTSKLSIHKTWNNVISTGNAAVQIGDVTNDSILKIQTLATAPNGVVLQAGDSVNNNGTLLLNAVGGNVGIGVTSPSGILHVDKGTGVGQFTLDGSTGGCIMLRDTDDGGWTECDALDGTLSCSVDADGLCD